MAKKTLKLDLELSYNFYLIGIVTAESDYRLCWLINDLLQISFQRIEDYNVKARASSSELYFPLFTYFDAIEHLKYYLIKNKSDDQKFLAPELKQVDYFFQVLGDVTNYKLNQIQAGLKMIDGVTAAILINVEGLKSRDMFLFQ